MKREVNLFVASAWRLPYTDVTVTGTTCCALFPPGSHLFPAILQGATIYSHSDLCVSPGSSSSVRLGVTARRDYAGSIEE